MTMKKQRFVEGVTVEVYKETAMVIVRRWQVLSPYRVTRHYWAYDKDIPRLMKRASRLLEKYSEMVA